MDDKLLPKFEEDKRNTVLCPVCFKAWTFTVPAAPRDIHCYLHRGFKVKTLSADGVEAARKIASYMMSQFPPCRPI